MGRQGEVTEIVSAELQFKAIGGDLAIGWRHHGGVVDQQIKALTLRLQPLTKGRNRGEVSQIQYLKADIGVWLLCSDFIDSLCTLRRITPGDNHLPASTRER